mmetsp:Transcript_31530/g.95296  ORF Transcript_31530/g.95296 Transcript_31530/m.95296 type:complete len:215 (+) Transcript_31530:406-1050(+)
MSVLVDILDRLEPQRVLAALAAVALPAHAVHAESDDLVRLARQRPQGHAARDEAAADLEGILDFGERDWLAVRGEFQQVADRGHGPAVHDLAAVLLVAHGRVLPHGLVERPGHVGVVQMELALVLHVLVPAREVELLGRLGVFQLREGPAVEKHRLVGHAGECQRAHGRRRPLERHLDDLVGKPDALEDLRTAVRLEHGDAHLGHDLLEAHDDR